jgi:transcriptional regulator with XRE-family HTH domain
MSRDSDPQAVTDALEAAIDAFNEAGYGIPTREDGIDSDADWKTQLTKACRLLAAIEHITGQEAALDRLLSLQEPEESDAAFARRLGIAPQVLSNYKNGHHGLSLESALKVHENAGISLDWLLAGHGSPWIPGEEEDRGFDAGTRYVFDRLAQSVTKMAEAMARAGSLDRGDAEAIRDVMDRALGPDGGEPES